MANDIDPLEGVAAHPDGWIEFGLRLLAAMSEPALYGLSRSEEVLEEVARLRGQAPESLMNTIRATQYLIEQFPAEYRRFVGNPNIGLSHVNLLLQLKEIETEEVDHLKSRVFKGEISYRELAAKVRNIREGALAELGLQLAASERIKARNRGRLFEEALKSFLTENVAALTGNASAKIESGHRLSPIAVDLIVLIKGNPAIAIEAKAPRSDFRQSLLVETLGVCSLVQRRIPTVWLVTPIGSRAGLKKVAAISRELAVPGVHFMVFDNQAPGSGLDALQEVHAADLV